MFINIFQNIPYLAGLILFFLAFTCFFAINISSLLSRFNLSNKKFYLESNSLMDQLKYFSASEKKMLSLNLMSAAFLGLIGFQLAAGSGAGVLVMLIGLVLGFVLPGLFLKVYRKKYFIKMENQLVSSLDLLAEAMQAGLNLPQAIDSTRTIIGYPISQEFTIITRQIRMGISIREALEKFAKRVPLSDIKLSAKAMTVSIQTGADLPVALKTIADTMRSRKQVQQKIKVLTAQGKAQGIVVGLLPVLIGGILFLMDPEYIKLLLSTVLGNCIIGVMVVMEVIAFFVIRKVITIDI